MLKSSKRIIITGESVVDEATVCTFSASIDCAEPEKTSIGLTQKDKEAYKKHRTECRADYAAFEDAVFAEVERLTDKQSEQN
jgi:hypothetical protein